MNPFWLLFAINTVSSAVQTELTINKSLTVAQRSALENLANAGTQTAIAFTPSLQLALPPAENS